MSYLNFWGAKVYDVIAGLVLANAPVLFSLHSIDFLPGANDPSQSVHAFESRLVNYFSSQAYLTEMVFSAWPAAREGSSSGGLRRPTSD